MNRITIKQATQAYRSIGAMPGRGTWGDRKTCCPLMTGFDGLEVKGRLPFDSQAGLDDGRAAAAALLG